MKGYITNNGHAIPIDDEVQHCPYDWCECEPELFELNGKLVWVHNPEDQRYLIDQAEMIRTCTSWDLFEEKKATYDFSKVQVIPFLDRSYLVQPRLYHRRQGDIGWEPEVE